MTRTGKIARLPRAIREQLNRRLADGEIAARLAQWLNTLPEVRAVLERDFGGRPISEQNLSEWRQGGFEEWLRHEDARAWVEQLAEQNADLEKESGAVPLADRIAYPVMLALIDLLQRALTSTDSAEQRRSIIGAAQQLTQLRRAGHQAEKLRLQKERWEAQQEEARQKASARAENLRLENERLELFREEARRDAAFRASFTPDFDLDTLAEALAPSPQLQPNPTRSNHHSSPAPKSPPKPHHSRASQTSHHIQPNPRRTRKPHHARHRACANRRPSKIARPK